MQPAGTHSLIKSADVILPLPPSSSLLSFMNAFERESIMIILNSVAPDRSADSVQATRTCVAAVNRASVSEAASCAVIIGKPKRSLFRWFLLWSIDGLPLVLCCVALCCVGRMGRLSGNQLIWEAMKGGRSFCG